MGALLPKWIGPCECPVFHHLRVTAPGAVRKNVDTLLIAKNGLEYVIGPIVIKMIARNRLDTCWQTCVEHGTTRREDTIARAVERDRNAASDAATGARYDGNSFRRRL
jgi:hypothetical protein